VRFVETPVFTGLVCRRLDDEDYRALQITLLLRPEQGALIPGSGGLRKIRWGAEGRGKRGGLHALPVREERTRGPVRRPDPGGGPAGP